MSTAAIVTGASSGIGKALLEALIKDPDCPDKVWAVARRKDRLIELSKLSDKIVPVEADLQTNEGIGVVTGLINKERPDVKILINSAGMGKRGDVLSHPASYIKDIVNLNSITLSILIRELVPFMSEGARIINIASSAAFLPQPGFAVYAASKAYVISFSRAMACELKSRKIKITAVCPGPVNTEFNIIATDGQSAEFKGFRKFFVTDADKLARLSLRASKRGRRLYVCGLSQKLLHLASKIFPTGFLLKIIYG